MDVLDLGRMAMVTDAGDAAIGIWQPGLHKGFGVLDEPAAPSYDDGKAGIMDASAFLPEGVGAQWSIYFGVADTDVALEQVVALGGTVVAVAQDSPYGRLAEVADPTAATFKLIG